MEEKELRLECLKLAMVITSPKTGEKEINLGTLLDVSTVLIKYINNEKIVKEREKE